MIRSVRALVLVWAATSIVSGCGNFPAYLKPFVGAKIDTGVTDYRHSDTTTGQFTYHFYPEECVGTSAATNSVDCRGNAVPKSYLIHENDSVSIDLLYGYICDFPEDAANWGELDNDFGDKKNVTPCWNSESKAGVKGEISVLATVFERDGKKQISFTQEQVGDDSARVVYYSDDVRETGQALNLSNLPIYGPVTYHGKPVFLRLAAVELDQKEVAETGAVLRALASLGAKAYPPASPVLQTLEKVGGAFLESQQDDLFFQYDMQFNGDGGVSPVSAPLAAGLVSFVRVQNRSTTFAWSENCLDRTTGKIRVRKDSSAACDENLDELTRHTYFTIQIRKNEPALKQDAYQTFADLNAISEEDAQLSTSLEELFSEARQKIEKTTKFDRARSLAKNLNSDSQVLKAQAREAFVGALCLGYAPANDGNSASFNEKEQLSTKRRYKLLELIETNLAESENSKFDVSSIDSESDLLAACGDLNAMTWISLFAQEEAERQADETGS